MLLCDDLIDALERLLAELFPPAAAPPPRPSSTLDEFPPDCQPGTAALGPATTAAVSRLLALFPAGQDVHDQVPIKIGATNSLPATIGGVTSRSVADPNFDYLVLIQLKAHRNRFNIVATLFHELGHVQDALVHGFLPYEAAPFFDVRDYVALVWQWELQAWRFMLQGVRAVVAAAPEHSMCMAVATAEDGVLSALHDDDVAGAMREIRLSYREVDQRADWARGRTAALTVQQTDDMAAYAAGIFRPDPDAWGL